MELSAGLLMLLTAVMVVESKIDREQVVRKSNPFRNASSESTPLQVGNGNFAFGVDVTGLQTFNPFATMSTWGWHNFSLPVTKGQTSPADFTGVDWWTHGRLVNYEQPNAAEPDISDWLIQNPHRINLGRIGFQFGGEHVTEDMLGDKSQSLDLYTGLISSAFTYGGARVEVETWADPETDSVGISVESASLAAKSLEIFFDFPYPTSNKFEAPFVGVFNQTRRHSTSLQTGAGTADIRHDLDNTTYFVSVRWTGDAQVWGPEPDTHRYHLKPSGNTRKIEMTVNFSPAANTVPPSPVDIRSASTAFWQAFWEDGAFIDLSSSESLEAQELQRRAILSLYLTAVNSASSLPPQESGLVNNGWYGKFHLEMVPWHLLPLARWNHPDLLQRSLPRTYTDLLASSVERAGRQGYAGARWGKMTDPSGRSAPGEINSLLVWQQPHVMYLAELAWRSSPNAATLAAWDEVLAATADFMASWAFWNETRGAYDLGPPLYPAPENTAPNATANPAFELAYWRFGLNVAVAWRERQGLSAPSLWAHVRDNLAPLPTAPVPGDGGEAFAVYEGISGMWEPNTTTVQDHPSMAAIYGFLPPPLTTGKGSSLAAALNMTVLRNTEAAMRDLWDLEDCWGWDFPMLAMNSLRMGHPGQAVAYLLHPLFRFDDAGYPEGGSRVPTPYLPGSGALLSALAMMAGGWDGAVGSHFPASWDARVEGFQPSM